MDFINGDILDKELINKHFRDADVVHHLAGSQRFQGQKVSLQMFKMTKLKKLLYKEHKIYWT